MRRSEHRSTIGQRNAGVSRWALGIGLLGAPLAWSVHFLVVWSIAEWSGLTGTLSGIFLGITSRAWLLFAVTVIALAAAVASILVARRCHRRLRRDEYQEPLKTAAWVARTGIINGYVFAFVIAFESVPIFFYL